MRIESKARKTREAVVFPYYLSVDMLAINLSVSNEFLAWGNIATHQ
jgi:hypothetical protein